MLNTIYKCQVTKRYRSINGIEQHKNVQPAHSNCSYKSVPVSLYLTCSMKRQLRVQSNTLLLGWLQGLQGVESGFEFLLLPPDKLLYLDFLVFMPENWVQAIFQIYTVFGREKNK